MTYPPLRAAVGILATLPLTIGAIGVTTVLALYLPETTGHTVDEVHEMWGPKKLSGGVCACAPTVCTQFVDEKRTHQEEVEMMRAK
jgi:hypothetical protein